MRRERVAGSRTAGFEVRVKLQLPDAAGPVVAPITRAEAQALALQAGDIVFVRPEPETPAPPSLTKAA